MQDMCPDVVVDLVEDAIVSVYGRQATPQVAPLLQKHAIKCWPQTVTTTTEPARVA